MFSGRGFKTIRNLLARPSLSTPVYKPRFFASPLASVRTFSAPQDNFMSGANANYIDYMYAQWEYDPSSVHASWNAYFANDSSYQAPPTLGQTAGAGVGDLSQIIAALNA